MFSEAEALVDSSVAVPLLVEDHPHHQSVSDAVGNRVLGLAGHAAFETLSVLTRLPPPMRREPDSVARNLGHDFPATRFLSSHAAAELLQRLGAVGIAGGAVFDALVGAAAAEHQLTLLTRDLRAVETYRRLGVPFTLLD
jgi:predicted nucleic acid-binding protein